MTEPEISVAAFNHWRYDRTAAMTLVDLCHGGALYYYESPYSCTIWVFAGGDAMLISYAFRAGVSPESVRDEVKRLLDVLHGGGDAGTLKRDLYPGLAALCKPGDDAVEVACFNPGDWCGLLHRDLPPHWDQLPHGWAESERARIERLVDQRVKIAQGSSLLDEIYPIGRALDAQGLFVRAEPVFRRALELEERRGNASGVASATQSLGVVAARQQRYEEAAALLGKAVAQWTAARGADDPRVASARASLERVVARSRGVSDCGDG
jgi:tetratricopeptide (TPR) repeat protein